MKDLSEEGLELARREEEAVAAKLAADAEEQRRMSTMELPPFVKIGAHKYTVGWKGDLSAHGKVRYDEASILIDEDIKGNHAEVLDTLLHESIHVINYHAGLGLGEKDVHRLAFHLTALLVDNDMLCDKLKP